VPLTYATPLTPRPGFRLDSPDGLWVVRTSDPATGHNMQAGGSATLVIRLNAETTFTSLTAHRQSDYCAFVDIDLTELALQALELVDLQHQIS